METENGWKEKPVDHMTIDQHKIIDLNVGDGMKNRLRPHTQHLMHDINEEHHQNENHMSDQCSNPLKLPINMTCEKSIISTKVVPSKFLKS
jgi:hypothetical protein